MYAEKLDIICERLKEAIVQDPQLAYLEELQQGLVRTLQNSNKSS